MSDLFSRNQKEPRWIPFVPLVAIAAIFLLEFETPSIRVTPSLLTILLALVAVFLSPRAVLWWAAILFFPVVLTLLLVPNNGAYETPVFVALRSAAYLAVAWVAVRLSRYRQDSDRKLEGLLALFDSLKTPIVVSDVDGNINFANRSCCELLGRSPEEMKDTSFFSVFTQPDQRGQSIERYLKFFESDPGRSSSMTVSVQNGTGELLRSANCFTMQWDEQKLLVTQLV